MKTGQYERFMPSVPPGFLLPKRRKMFHQNFYAVHTVGQMAVCGIRYNDLPSLAYFLEKQEDLLHHFLVLVQQVEITAVGFQVAGLLQKLVLTSHATKGARIETLELA